MEKPKQCFFIIGDLPESECLEEDCRYEENDESNLCRFCTKPVGEDCKDVFSGDDEIVKIQEMINVILPGQVLVVCFIFSVNFQWYLLKFSRYS